MPDFVIQRNVVKMVTQRVLVTASTEEEAIEISEANDDQEHLKLIDEEEEVVTMVFPDQFAIVPEMFFTDVKSELWAACNHHCYIPFWYNNQEFEYFEQAVNYYMRKLKLH